MQYGELVYCPFNIFVASLPLTEFNIVDSESSAQGHTLVLYQHTPTYNHYRREGG